MSKLKHMVKVYRNEGKPIIFNKEPLRNDSCPCQSGKKYKQCHLGNFEGLVKLLQEKYSQKTIEDGGKE